MSAENNNNNNMTSTKDTAPLLGDKKMSRSRESLHAIKELVGEDKAAKPEATNQQLTIEEAINKYKTSIEFGLSNDDAKNRLATNGPNALPEKKENKFLKFLSFMWSTLSFFFLLQIIIILKY
jgi:magnesium-transporting ATPase (P-type)